MIDLKKQPQTFLYICSGMTQSFRERSLIRDVSVVRELGHTPIVLCKKNSPLAQKCKELGISWLPLQGGKSGRFQWTQLRMVVDIVERYHIDLIHCYDLNLIWPLSFFLRKRNKLPLVLTFVDRSPRGHHRWWHKRLLKRVDRIVLPMRELTRSFKSQLPFDLGRLSFLGLGLDISSRRQAPYDGGNFCLGIHYTGDEQEFKAIQTATKILNEVFGQKKFKLIVYSDIELNIDPSIGENILVRDSIDFSGLHLWVESGNSSSIDEYSIGALLNQTPVLFQRNNFLGPEILAQMGRVGESYKNGDVRELKDKILEIEASYGEIIEKLAQSTVHIREIHGVAAYRPKLVKLYEKLLNSAT